MRRAQVVVLVLALGAGGSAAVLVMRSEPPPAPVLAPAPQIAMVEILVAKSDIGIGRRLIAEQVQWQPWPASAASSEYFRQGDNPAAELLVAVEDLHQDWPGRTVLELLGHHFTRPKMRALCKVLSFVDDEAEARGEPELAVLVVRQSDGLPGQGWWVGGARKHGYTGLWNGPKAAKLIRTVQSQAFDYWAGREA